MARTCFTRLFQSSPRPILVSRARKRTSEHADCLALSGPQPDDLFELMDCTVPITLLFQSYCKIKANVGIRRRGLYRGVERSIRLGPVALRALSNSHVMVRVSEVRLSGKSGSQRLDRGLHLALFQEVDGAVGVENRLRSP